MDTLINKWKQTVENHNRKLTQLREDSLGRSQSKDRSVFLSQSQLQTSMAKDLNLTQDNSVQLRNRRKLSSYSKSSQSGSPLRITQHQPQPQQTVLPKKSKENKPPLLNSQQVNFEEEFFQHCIEQVFSLFPESKLKSKKTAKLRDLIVSNYSTQLKSIQKTGREIKGRESEKKEGVAINEATTRKVSELEQKLQESERDRNKLRFERDQLLQTMQQSFKETDDLTLQSQIIQVLRRTQEGLEISNQKMEEMFVDNKKRFREKEEVWEQELSGLRGELDLLRVKIKK